MQERTPHQPKPIIDLTKESTDLAPSGKLSRANLATLQLKINPIPDRLECPINFTPVIKDPAYYELDYHENTLDTMYIFESHAELRKRIEHPMTRRPLQEGEFKEIPVAHYRTLVYTKLITATPPLADVNIFTQAIMTNGINALLQIELCPFHLVMHLDEEWQLNPQGQPVLDQIYQVKCFEIMYLVLKAMKDHDLHDEISPSMLKNIISFLYQQASTDIGKLILDLCNSWEELQEHYRKTFHGAFNFNEKILMPHEYTKKTVIDLTDSFVLDRSSPYSWHRVFGDCTVNFLKYFTKIYPALDEPALTTLISIFLIKHRSTHLHYLLSDECPYKLTQNNYQQILAMYIAEMRHRDVNSIYIDFSQDTTLRLVIDRLETFSTEDAYTLVESTLQTNGLESINKILSKINLAQGFATQQSMFHLAISNSNLQALQYFTSYSRKKIAVDIFSVTDTFGFTLLEYVHSRVGDSSEIYKFVAHSCKKEDKHPVDNSSDWLIGDSGGTSSASFSFPDMPLLPDLFKEEEPLADHNPDRTSSPSFFCSASASNASETRLKRPAETTSSINTPAKRSRHGAAQE